MFAVRTWQHQLFHSFPLFTNLQNLDFLFSSLLQRVLYRILSFLIASPLGTQYSQVPIFLPYSFSSPRSSFSVCERGSQAWTFQQTRAIKVALARIYWEILIVLFKWVPKSCWGGKNGEGFFQECYEFGKSSHSANDSQAVQFLYSPMVTRLVCFFLPFSQYWFV